MTREIRVLHVDDDPQFADLTVEFLESLNDAVQVQTVTDPTQALDTLSPEAIDCIVSDYDMPGMNGIEFLEAIREHHPDLPVILFTGKGSEEVASEAISAGVTDYLQKNPGTDQFHLLLNRITNAVEQRRATAAAEQTERRLRELAENTTDALWMFSGDWSELLFVNTVVTDLFGLSPSELYQDPDRFLDPIHATHRDQVERAMCRVTEGYPIELEYRVTPETGTARWVWMSGEPILDDDGDVVRIVGFTRDITDRKRRERERREAARRLDVVLDNVQAGIWMRDADRRFLLANDTFQRTFGGDPSLDVVGCLPEDLFDADTAAALSALDDEVLENGAPLELERTLPSVDGDRTYLVRITPLHDETGEISATCGIATDITERKRHQNRLQGQSERLAAVTDIVTGDLLPAIADGNGCPSRAEAIVEAVATVTTGRDLSREPVDPETLARLAWESVEPADGTLSVQGTASATADPRLIEQLFRTIFRTMNQTTNRGVDIQLRLRADRLTIEGPEIDEHGETAGIEPGKADPLTVVQCIVREHGWTLDVEGDSSETTLVITGFADGIE